MSILSSLYTGASGMTAHGGAIGIVGDNIANASTIGFKRSRADFADVLGGNLGGQRLGAGVRLGGADSMFEQGSIQQTGGTFDLAIRGNGMFAVKGAHGGQTQTYYTRDGRFGLDNQGYVTNEQGLRLQGYMIDDAGAVATSATDLDLAGHESPPVATTAANLSYNLDSTKPVAAAWNPAAPAGTSQTSVTVHDSLGNEHKVDIYFLNQGGGKWEWHATVDGGELNGGTAGTPTEIATGTVEFNAAGALDKETPGASSASFVGAAAGQAIKFDFGDAITTDGGTGISGTTQYAQGFATNGVKVDGRAAGKLTDVSIGDDGTMTGTFDNGDTHAIAQVALATFGAEQELTRAGDGLYTESAGSGQPLLAAAGNGGRGAISQGALEGSNVDLGNELVTMIAYQRAFQANSKTVTTADEMLAQIAELVR
ncbi:MAG TPA: flagellar hook protein FlgE [Kofleriaceae bacterium]|nr:flagellar hook protein FlgE [Kofleriaceae bacterium]